MAKVTLGTASDEMKEALRKGWEVPPAQSDIRRWKQVVDEAERLLSEAPRFFSPGPEWSTAVDKLLGYVRGEKEAKDAQRR